MTPFKFLAATAAAALLAVPALARPAAPRQLPEGIWLNPHNSVAVRMGSCGDKLCGWIVWANAEAQSDARDSGVARLVGTELLEDYRPTGTRNWSGTVFVPDMGHHFSSQIDQLSANQLKVKGCVLGGLICKSQVWTRINDIPHA